MVRMDKRQQILILGNSLILNILGESLKGSGHFDLTTLEMTNDFMDVEHMKPDAILFDLESPHMESIFSLSENCSKLLLVGVSPDTNIVKVWSGRQLRELSIQGLLAMIDDQLHVSLTGGGST